MNWLSRNTGGKHLLDTVNQNLNGNKEYSAEGQNIPLMLDMLVVSRELLVLVDKGRKMHRLFCVNKIYQCDLDCDLKPILLNWHKK